MSVVDVKAEAGRAVIHDLVSRSDVLIEGFRPGVMERLGLGPDALLAINPKLIFGRMTGWGQEGPLAQAAGHDINYIALAGVLEHIGTVDDPYRRSTSLAISAEGACCSPSVCSPPSSIVSTAARGKLSTRRWSTGRR